MPQKISMALRTTKILIEPVQEILELIESASNKCFEMPVQTLNLAKVFAECSHTPRIEAQTITHDSR